MKIPAEISMSVPGFSALLEQIPSASFLEVFDITDSFEKGVYSDLEKAYARLSRVLGSRTSERKESALVAYERLGDKFKPTKGQFLSYQGAFDYFNDVLFAGSLPQCLLNFSRSSKKSIGFFAPNRWGNRVDVNMNQAGATSLHEITLNPEYLTKEPERVFSTLVHEMCHLQRQVTGKAPRGGYHDKQWAEMMQAVGLQPFNIANPLIMTGAKVSHEIVSGGAYQVAFVAMPVALLLPLSCVPESVKAKKAAVAKNKVKYTCPGCESNAWGKPGLNLRCADCLDDEDEMMAYGCEPAPDAE